MKPFEQASFVVTFFGEGACSRVLHGWRAVLHYIDYQLGDEEARKDLSQEYYGAHHPDDPLHDPDEWRHVDHSDCGDSRLHFDKSEYAYCVGLAVTRITDE